jgi:capsular exopolysaccharide synthesis family protein
MSRRNSKRSSEPVQETFDEGNDFGSSSSHSRERLQQLLHDILGRWHWIALCLVLGLLGGLYYLAKAPEEYSATSSLLIKQRASSVMTKELDDDLDLRASDSMNTIAQRATRIELLTKVAGRPDVLDLEGLLSPKVNWFPEWSLQWLGMEKKEAPDVKSLKTTDLANRIGFWSSVRVRPNTRLLDITVKHRDPDVCKVLADAIAAEYVDELGGKRSENQGSNAAILEAKSKEAQGILEQRQEALANYQQALTALRQLEEKEISFSALNRRYKSKHPVHMSAKATLDEFQKRFMAEFIDVRNSPVDQEYWNEHRAEWEQTAPDSNSQLQVAKRLLSARATVLSSEIESKGKLYNQMVTKLMALDVDRGVEEAGLEMNNLSFRPNVPSSPKKASVIMSASMAGLGAGLALAFLLTKLDTKLHSVIQAELLTDLPVLATINDLQPKILQKIVANKGVDQSAEPPARKKWDRRIVFREGLTDSIYAESFRILRASVSLLGEENKRKVTLFSSALPGEGKTLTSTNFAMASAQQGKKTLLIDFDLRKPSVHRSFGLFRSELSSGATELLAGKVTFEEAVSKDTGQENLFCLFGGVKAPNPGELLNSDSVTELLKAAEQYFDVIVIDSAPLLAVPDTRLLIPLVDNFCFVLRAEKTPKAAIRKAIELLKDDGSEPAGIVINAYEEKGGILARKYRSGYGGYGQYGKGYGYGSYGSYGSDDDD